jgi:hypothetical protein
MSTFRAAPIPYGYGGVAYNYTQQANAEAEAAAYRALQEQRYQESMAAQRAGQQYQNQAQGITNANQIANMQGQTGALGLNYAGDAIQRQLAMLRAGGDLAQQSSYQRDARRNAMLNVAQTQFGQNQQRLNMQDDLTRLNYQRANNEVTSDFSRFKKAYGI